MIDKKNLLTSRILFCFLPSQRLEEVLLYVHVDISCRIPPAQVTEQDESSLQVVQVGHDCVLHGSFLVRLEASLSNETKTLV